MGNILNQGNSDSIEVKSDSRIAKYYLLSSRGKIFRRNGTQRNGRCWFRNGEKSERVREKKGEWEVASMKALALINVIVKEEKEEEANNNNTRNTYMSISRITKKLYIKDSTAGAR